MMSWDAFSTQPTRTTDLHLLNKDRLVEISKIIVYTSKGRILRRWVVFKIMLSSALIVISLSEQVLDFFTVKNSQARVHARVHTHKVTVPKSQETRKGAAKNLLTVQMTVSFAKTIS